MTIGRVRVRHRAGTDSLAIGQLTRRMLEGGTFLPSGLAPAAILCIRRLADTRLRVLHLPSDAIRPPTEWEQRVARVLETAARTAARPAREFVPSNVEAVLFADRSEVLACLARDLLNGDAGSKWWWRFVVGSSEPRSAVVREWTACPAHVPAALDQLSKTGHLEPFVSVLSGLEVDLLLRCVVEAHALNTAVLDGVGVPEPVAGSVPVPPWQSWVAEPLATLGADQQVLVGVCLCIRRAQHAVRSAEFAPAVRAWRSSIHATQDSGLRQHQWRAQAEERRESAMSVSSSVDPRPSAPRLTSAADSDDPPNVNLQDAVPWSVTVGDTSVAGVSAVRMQAISPAASVMQSGQEQQPVHAPHPVHARPPIFARQPVEVDPSIDPMPAAGPQLGGVVKTGYGGVFYLLNLGIALGLYADFTTPAERGLELPIWDFVAAIGRRLVGPRLEKDPAWRLLAELAGRGVGQLPPRCPAQLELLARSRLEQALGTRRRLGRLVCQHAALIHLSPTHVDLVFSLADLPIAIRLAGLDRDPGWVPSAARIVTFHFE